MTNFICQNLSFALVLGTETSAWKMALRHGSVYKEILRYLSILLHFSRSILPSLVPIACDCVEWSQCRIQLFCESNFIGFISNLVSF